MKLKPKISIVVPVYNVAKYLKRCIDSILAQTFSDFEVILVNDGSTDESSEICDLYASKDNRVRVIHKPNGGLSSARNIGIENATGTYIGFVDSDDYIAEDMYEVLYRNIQREQADMSLCSLFDVYGDKVQKIERNPRYMVLDAEEAIRIVLEAKITSVTAVNKLYRRELFDNVKYPEGRVAEDAFVIVQLLKQCRKVVLTTEQKYYYIHREGSITTRKFSKRDCDVIDAYLLNLQIIEEEYPSIIDVARMRVCWANFYVLDKLMMADTKEHEDIKIKVIRFLKSQTIFIIRNPYFNTSRKLALMSLCISSYLYKLCVLWQRKRFELS